MDVVLFEGILTFYSPEVRITPNSLHCSALREAIPNLSNYEKPALFLLGILLNIVQTFVDSLWVQTFNGVNKCKKISCINS